MKRAGREGTGNTRDARVTGAVVNTVLLMIVAVASALPTLLGAQQPASGAAAVPSGEALTLPDAVSMALRRNRDVRDARFALDLAREQVSEAWGGIMPTVSMNADYTRNLSRAVSFLPAFIFNPDAGPDELLQVQFGADNSWNTSISVEQPLFDARVFVGLGAAQRLASIQEEFVRGRSQSLVTRVRLAYYDLLLAQEQERLTLNSVTRVRQSLKETRAMNRAGLASDYDMLRIEVELANLEPNLRRAENAATQFRRVLAVELAVDDQESLQVAGSLATMDLEDPALNTPGNRAILAFAGSGPLEGAAEQRVTQAWERRSDLRQLEMTERLRHSEMRLEQMQYMPTISFFGNYVIQAQQNGAPDFFGDPMSRASAQAVGITVSVPIFEGFRKDARVDQRRAAWRQAETQSRLARDQAASQVKSLVELADEARARARGQKLAVAQAQRGFEIAAAQYREGLSGQLELTDAEVALRQSEFNYAQAVYDYLVAWAQLDEATGSVPMVDSEFTLADGQ